MQKQNPGMRLIVGLLGMGATLFLLTACADAKKPAARTDTAAFAERASFLRTPLPPIQFKPEEMGDFPPVGSPNLPAKLEFKQE